MNNIMLRVSTSIRNSGESDFNSFELVTEARYEEKGGCHYIFYDESELSGMEGTTTSIKIDAVPTVALKRSGGNTSHMLYEKGKKSDSIYNTPYGNFDMSITTRDIVLEKIDESVKSLSIDYRMRIEGLTESENKVLIEIM
jgi:uncharacterized beta-barrel protein YwiB (DUF1934 family)